MGHTTDTRRLRTLLLAFQETSDFAARDIRYAKHVKTLQKPAKAFFESPEAAW